MTELTMSDEAKKQVLRTNLVVAWAFFPLMLLALVVSALLLQMYWLLAAYVVVLVLGAVGTTVLARRMVDRSRVVFGDGSYSVHGTGRAKRFTAAEAARVVTVDRMALGNAGPTHHLIVVGPSSRLLILVGQMWSREQLSALALDLAHRGVPLTPFHAPVTPVQLRAHDRRLMPWWQAHPYGFASLLVGAVMVVAVVAFVVVISLVVS